MDKSEYRYQWSKQVDGEIIVVRADTTEDFEIDIEWARVLLNAPKNKYEGKTLEEIEDDLDPSWCDTHSVKMKAREGKNGTFYSHSRPLGDGWDYCSGNGWKSEK